MTSLSRSETPFASTDRGFGAAVPQADRRRYPRHNNTWTGGTVSMIDCEEMGPLVDLSFGGMSFELRRPLKMGETVAFRVDVGELMARVANVEARICRLKQAAPNRFRVGAEFVTSDQAWLGPEEI